jgi:hypothetical protein
MSTQKTNINETIIHGWDYVRRVAVTHTLGDWRRLYDTLIIQQGTVAVLSEWLLLLNVNGRLLFDVQLPNESFLKYFHIYKDEDNARKPVTL